jgi:anti-sigma factor RsiW
MSNECDILLEQVPAYCTGELDADERARFESALPACPEANAEIAHYRRMTAGLLHAVSQVAAPASARARLLDALDDTAVSKIADVGRDVLQGVRSHADGNQDAQTYAMPEAKPTQPRPPGRTAVRQIGIASWLRTRHTSSLLAAAVALLLGVTAYLLVRVNALEKQLAAVPASLVSELGAGTLGRIELASTAGVEGQEGRLGWVTTQDGNSWVAWLVVDNLPTLAEGEVYHLWLERANESPLSVGRFRIANAESTAFAFVIGIPIEAFDRAYVTRERADTPAPSSDPVLLADI